MSAEEQVIVVEQLRREIKALLGQIRPPLSREDIEVRTAAIVAPFIQRKGADPPPP